MRCCAGSSGSSGFHPEGDPVDEDLRNRRHPLCQRRTAPGLRVRARPGRRLRPRPAPGRGRGSLSRRHGRLLAQERPRRRGCRRRNSATSSISMHRSSRLSPGLSICRSTTSSGRAPTRATRRPWNDSGEPARRGATSTGACTRATTASVASGSTPPKNSSTVAVLSTGARSTTSPKRTGSSGCPTTKATSSG